MTGSPFFLTTRAPEPSEWVVVGWSEDPVRHGDADKVAEALRRYRKIATTLDSVVTRMAKISAGADRLEGEYAVELLKKIEELQERLGAAAVRYADVAREVTTYEPVLRDAITETRGGLEEGKAAASALTAAEAQPDAEPDEDGVLDAQAVADDARKRESIATADSALAAAKKRVQTAYDRLQAAGKHLGHTVSARRYDDGLTDSTWDKVVAALKKVSKALAIIGMVLAVLCFIFPGVAALLVAAAVVAVAAMVVAAVLYAKNEEGLPDLIFAVLGVVLLGGAVWATRVTRMAGAAGRTAVTAKYGTLKIPASIRQLDGAGNVVTRLRPPVARWKPQSDWFDNPLSKWIFTVRGSGYMVPEVGLVRSSIEQMKAAGRMWGQLRSMNLVGFSKEWLQGVSGWAQFRQVQGLRELTVASTWKWAWLGWTGGNSVFTLGTGLIFTGLRTEWRDWRDQAIPDIAKLEDL